MKVNTVRKLSASQDRFLPLFLEQKQEQSASGPAILWVMQEIISAWFRSAAHKWKQETGGLSSISAKISHPAFKQIVDKGPSILPLIFQDMKTDTAHWFPALKMITKVDPVPAEHRGDFIEMKRAWLKWGREQGFLD